MIPRPLKVLRPLIRAAHAKGDIKALADLIREAQPQVPFHSWSRWLKRILEDPLARQDRQEARRLARQLIDLGYRAMAQRLHPDHGGSSEAMVRLQRVRAVLKKVRLAKGDT